MSLRISRRLALAAAALVAAAGAASFQAAAICQEQYGSAGVEARGWLHWCLP